MISTSFPLSADGSEAAGAFAADVALELGRHIPVRVVAPGRGPSRERFGLGVEVYRFDSPVKPLSTLSYRSPADLAWMARVLAGGRAATVAAVRDAPTAHQLALWALPSGYWARCAQRTTGVPYSVWTLGSDIWSLGRMPLVRSYLRRVVAGAASVFSDGFALAAETQRLAGRPVEFLPSARNLHVERRQTGSLPAPYSLLFIGRWHANKGIDLLLDALSVLDDQHWSKIRTVVVCGGGPLEDRVRADAANLRARGRPLELHGYVDAAEAARLIADTDYLLIPSRVESIPVVFSDAIRNGCPVVAMPVGDLPRLVGDEQTGVLADEVSAAAFAAALAKALRTCPSNFRSAADRLAPTFSVPESIVPRILDLACAPRGSAVVK